MPVPIETTKQRDISRFLATHEACASDFEIRRTGGGDHTRLEVACGGCGEAAAYDASEPGALRALEAAPVPQRVSRVTRAELERWLPAPPALPWWVPNAYIAAVILIGLALIGVGVTRPGSGGGPATDTDTGTAPPPALNATPAPVGPAPDPEPEQRRAEAPELDRITVLDRFRIGVPDGWLRGMLSGAVVLHSPAGAEVRVFLERRRHDLDALARQASQFLAAEHPSASVGDRARIRLGDRRAIRLRARWDDGREDAVVIAASGYAYLVLSRVDNVAPDRVADEAEATLSSFRPR